MANDDSGGFGGVGAFGPKRCFDSVLRQCHCKGGCFMSKQNFKRREFLGLMGGTALAALWPGGGALAADSGALLTLGFQDSVWGSVAMVADKEQVFKKAGANVKVLKFDSGKTVRDSMISGRIDIGTLGTTPFIVGAAKGDIVALATVAYAGRTDSVVAGAKTNIKSVKELKGKRIASQVGSSTDYIFQNKIIPAYGLKKGDYQIVNTKFRDQVAALAAGSVDAFAGVEPYPSVAVLDGIGRVLVNYSKYDMLPVWLAINQPVLEIHPKEVVAFMKGWLMAVKTFKDDPKHVAKIVWESYTSQGYTIKEDAIDSMMGKFDVNPNYVKGLKHYLNQQAEVLLKAGRISKIPDWDKVLNHKILEEARSA
jgi:aliphatic sulfonates family ABC transporter substrate-binding protein